MCEFIRDTLATFLGGLLLAGLLFFLNEYCFVKINVTGEWAVTVKIENTPHREFKGLAIEYKFHMLQKGFDLSGSGEKVKDIHTDGTETVFLREKRVNVTIDGYFERKYFRKSAIYLNIEEEGRKRETRATYSLMVQNKNTLVGKFISTAADSSGQIGMIKT